jgi:predicted AlkP superfamily phosphohydrolase/phosphomutase
MDRWRERRGIPPDLVVYFADLAWRSNGSLGYGSIWTFENDTGPDDANHAQHGLWMAAGPGIEPGRKDMRLVDIAPLILRAAHAAPPLAGVPAAGDA